MAIILKFFIIVGSLYASYLGLVNVVADDQSDLSRFWTGLDGYYNYTVAEYSAALAFEVVNVFDSSSAKIWSLLLLGALPVAVFFTSRTRYLNYGSLALPVFLPYVVAINIKYLLVLVAFIAAGTVTKSFHIKLMLSSLFHYSVVAFAAFEIFRKNKLASVIVVIFLTFLIYFYFGVLLRYLFYFSSSVKTGIGLLTFSSLYWYFYSRINRASDRFDVIILCLPLVFNFLFGTLIAWRIQLLVIIYHTLKHRLARVKLRYSVVIVWGAMIFYSLYQFFAMTGVSEFEL